MKEFFKAIGLGIMAFFQKILEPLEEQDKVLSMRRCLALFFAVVALLLLLKAFQFLSFGWIVFIPGGLGIVASLLLLFFTTWSDISGVVGSITGNDGKGS
jgi:hypothetical protein